MGRSLDGCAKATEVRLGSLGPTEHFSSGEDLFHSMKRNFERYGDIFRATVYGSVVYVVSAPEYCEHILRRN
jgi:hypothetical protein